MLCFLSAIHENRNFFLYWVLETRRFETSDSISHCRKIYNCVSKHVTHKGKGKVVPVLLTEHHAIKAYWGSGGIAPLIL
jgi:hypothetical protein